jgi:hypothetical protein
VLYAEFCVPSGNDVVVMVGGTGAALTVMLSASVARCPLASVTRTVKLLVPVPLGVPEITPVLVASASPAGRLPKLSDQL